MSDKEKLPKLCTIDELKYLEQLNQTALSKTILENQVKHQEKMFPLLLEQQSLTLKTLEVDLQFTREGMRPSRIEHTFVCYDRAEQRYRCQIPLYPVHDMDEDGDDDDSFDPVTIVAYGDTPAQACDNFDHLWVQGLRDAK